MNLTGKQNYWILLRSIEPHNPKVSTTVGEVATGCNWCHELVHEVEIQSLDALLATKDTSEDLLQNGKGIIHSLLRQVFYSFKLHYGSLTVSLCWSSFLQWNPSTRSDQYQSDFLRHCRTTTCISGSSMIWKAAPAQANFKDGDEVSSLRRVSLSGGFTSTAIWAGKNRMVSLAPPALAGILPGGSMLPEEKRAWISVSHQRRLAFLLLERLDIEMCSIYSLQDCCSLICCSLPHPRLQLWNLCLSLFAESESIEFPLTRSMKLIFDGTGVFEELHVNFIARRRQLLIETIHWDILWYIIYIYWDTWRCDIIGVPGFVFK